VYCRLRYNRKVRHAIINLKRGYRGEDKENKSKAYVEDYDCQMQIEKLLWHQTYPDWPVDLVCNWSPNNWRTAPTYTFKAWTSTNWPESKLKVRLPQIHEDGRFNPAKPKAYMSGKYKPGDDLSKCIKKVVLKKKY
jgi:hypothetical protein